MALLDQIRQGVAPVPQEALLGDRSSMVYLGTFVAAGSGTGIVVATAQRPSSGRISTLVGSIEPLATPLIRQMNALARTLTAIILALSVAVLCLPCSCEVMHGPRRLW
jgi:magnesium-transporting ATPase (P-type)